MKIPKSIKTLGLVSLLGLAGCGSKEGKSISGIEMVANLTYMHHIKTPGENTYYFEKKLNDGRILQITYRGDRAKYGETTPEDSVTINLTYGKSKLELHDAGLNGLNEREGDYLRIMRPGITIEVEPGNINELYGRVVDTSIHALAP